MFESLDQIFKKAKQENKSFWEVVIEDDCKERNADKDTSFAQMTEMYQAMKKADANYDKNLKSRSRLVGGDGYKMAQAVQEGNTLSGSFVSTAIEKAIKMGESNACMKKIVAAPTAGSCGVIPAVFLTYEENHTTPVEEMTKALFVTAGIGQVIAHRASISGAEGGCQAEIGSASAMAAGGLAFLKGGDADCIVHAAAMALTNLLGLTCDPVAGLVEIPCVKRNVIGAVNALCSADMALAGIISPIPPDQVIDAMRMIGDAMPSSLKETSKGGLAITPAGASIQLNE